MRTRTIPQAFLEALSYGPVDYHTNQFLSWLSKIKREGVERVMLPLPFNLSEQCMLACARASIYECANTVGIRVSSVRLTKRIFLKVTSTSRQEIPFRFPNPFEQIVVIESGIVFVPFQ